MKGRAETLQKLNNTVGHLAGLRDQCLFDWLRERDKETARDIKRERLTAAEG